MKKRISVVVLLALLAAASAFAVDYYDTGSQMFNINVGGEFPLSSTTYSVDQYKTTQGMGINGTHIKFGGIGSIDYEIFSSPKLAFGGEIGYQFNYVVDDKIFTEIPILAKATFIPVQGKFETLFSMGLGINYMSYNNMSKFCMTASASAGCRYFISESWGVGLNTGIQATPEIYFQNFKKSGLVTFIPAVVSITYRH